MKDCSVNGKHGKFSHSPRKHGRPGRIFVICGYCKEELQATSSGIFDTNPAKHRADPPKKHITARIPVRKWELWKRLGLPADVIFLAGLAAVTQEQLKQ